jgi:hypothetical protein
MVHVPIFLPMPFAADGHLFRSQTRLIASWRTEQPSPPPERSIHI